MSTMSATSSTTLLISNIHVHHHVTLSTVDSQLPHKRVTAKLFPVLVLKKCIYLLIVSNSMMTLGHWLINHSADVQERHMVYEYWVSFSGETGLGGSIMERETAELIQPLVCNINKQKCGLQHWILSRTISPFFLQNIVLISMFRFTTLICHLQTMNMGG